MFKKFLFKSIPDDINFTKVFSIVEMFICINKDREFRLKKIKDLQINESINYFIIKRGSGFNKIEDDFIIDQKEYINLFNYNYQAIVKDRKYFNINNCKVMIDIYRNDIYRDLKIIKVIFNSKIQADNFKALSWFGKEITDNTDYDTKNLWLKLNEG